MAVQVIGLTLDGGLPLFHRNLDGKLGKLPFSVIASLNGVYMFGSSQATILGSTSSENTTIVWRQFDESIVLIGISYAGHNETLLDKLLTTMYRTVVLLLGINEIRNPRNVDILKRELRMCYPLMDMILKCVEPTHLSMLGLSQVIISQDCHLLQCCMDSFAECCNSLYGCLMINGNIVVATNAWWTLDHDDTKLLILMLTSDYAGTSTACDIPIFPPTKSPDLPFRLVSCCLIVGVQVCILCGPMPSLAIIEEQASECWQGAIDILRINQDVHPLNIGLDPDIIGFLLVDQECGKFVTSHLDSTNRQDVLRTFYYEIASSLLVSSKQVNETQSNEIQVMESYWCSEYHKCHARKQGNQILCVLYASSVPTHAIRIITRKTMDSLAL